jgi:hypothetical protein
MKKFNERTLLNTFLYFRVLKKQGPSLGISKQDCSMAKVDQGGLGTKTDFQELVSSKMGN